MLRQGVWGGGPWSAFLRAPRWLSLLRHSTRLCRSPAPSDTEPCTLKCWKSKLKDGTGEGQEDKCPVLLHVKWSRERLLSVQPFYVSRQFFVSPAQPNPTGKCGVVRPHLSSLSSPLPWLCFDRCVQGWRSGCQLSPCQARGAGGRPGGSAQPAVLPQLEVFGGSPPCLKPVEATGTASLLRRRPRNCFQGLQIWLGLKHVNGKGHDFTPVTAVLRAIASWTGVRLCRFGPGRAGGRALS